MYISYSLWGDNEVYTYGMIENVLAAKEIYSEWVVRIHYNDTVPKKIIDWLSEQSNVEMVHHEGMDKLASNTFWRFYDMFLPNTTVLIRDADSRLTVYEKEMVDEWLSSDKDFHVIRGYPTHKVPILAGTCGCRNSLLQYTHINNGVTNINALPRSFIPSETFLEWYQKQLPKEHDKYLVDQIFLYQYVYPMIANSLFVHSVKENAYEPFSKVIPYKSEGYMGEIVNDCPRAAKIMGDDNITFERVPVYN